MDVRGLCEYPALVHLGLQVLRDEDLSGLYLPSVRSEKGGEEGGVK